MAVNLDVATFEALSLRVSGKFENISCPILLSHSAHAPFGVEVESRFAPLPIFAGGTDPRKHLTVQLEVSEEDAAGLRRLDEACEKASTSPGAWSPLVTLRDGRLFVKVRLQVVGPRPSTLRIGGEDLQPGSWAALEAILLAHHNLRGAQVKAAIRAGYVWSVSGRRGISLSLEQLVVETPKEAQSTLDYFM